MLLLCLCYGAPGFILKSQIKSPGQGGGGERTERKKAKKKREGGKPRLVVEMEEKEDPGKNRTGRHK